MAEEKRIHKQLCHTYCSLFLSKSVRFPIILVFLAFIIYLRKESTILKSKGHSVKAGFHLNECNDSAD